jgi:hypothetical protein
LQETSFFILMCVDVSSAKFKAKGAKSWPSCIFDTINKFLDVITDEFPKHLLLSCIVDHKIEVMFGLMPPFNSPY